MEKLIAYLRKLVGLELTIDSVTARQSKVVRDLDKIEKIYKEKAAKADRRAKAALEAAKQATLEASDAAELSTNWSNSGLIRPSRKIAV